MELQKNLPMSDLAMVWGLPYSPPSLPLDPFPPFHLSLSQEAIETLSKNSVLIQYGAHTGDSEVQTEAEIILTLS